MKFSDLIKMGLRNLRRRKARTLLTVIGVIIGTISIVVMISIGIGMNQTFQEQIMENGSMTIINISTWGAIYDDDGNYVDSTTQKLTLDAVEQIKQIEHVNAVTPRKYVNGNFFCGKYQSWFNGYAIDFSMLESFGFPGVVEGTDWRDGNTDLILFGSEARQSEFYNYSSRDRSSKTINWGRDKVTLGFNQYMPSESKRPFSYLIKDYGVFEESTNWEINYNSYIDWNFYKELYTQYANTLNLDDRKKALNSLNEFDNIQINVDNMKNVTQVQDEIKALGYISSSDMQYIEPMQETANMLQMVLGAIGGIAMLVSAINIANTMIMSIYERTKEIGIMKVLGCLVKDVKKLFLFEAGMIGLMGGIIGIGLSYIASWAINTYGGSVFESFMSSMISVAGEGQKFSRIPLWLPFLAAAFAMGVGVLSGYLPAKRATKISAIEAMKTES